VKKCLQLGLLLVISFVLTVGGPGVSRKAQGAGRNPRGPYEYFFAEGTTRTGYEEYLCLGSPEPEVAAVDVTVECFLSDGATIAKSFHIEEDARLTVNVADLVGKEKDVALRVFSEWSQTKRAPWFTAERVIYFHVDGISGAHCVGGIPSPSERWYFAEGYTGKGYSEFLSVLNPENETAQLEVEFLPLNGERKVVHMDVPARSRSTVDVAREVGPDREVSSVIRSDNRVPVVAERPMYFATSSYDGGHCSAGASIPQNEFYFAEGTTRDGFQEYICLLNPWERDIRVDAGFLLEDGSEIPYTVDIPAFSRRTIDVNAVVGPGRDVAAELRSSGVFCSERAVYFNAFGTNDGHCSEGAGYGSRRWCFAEGTTRSGFRSFICIENSKAEKACVYIHYLGGGTGDIVSYSIEIAPRSRVTIDPRDYLGMDYDFLCLLESNKPIIAERVQYSDDSTALSGGHCALGQTGGGRTRFGDVESYLNTYGEYKYSDLDTFMKYDVAVLDPYDYPEHGFPSSLQGEGTVVLAYIDIGEVEDSRSYWPNVKKTHPELMLGPNPDWPGCYYADVNNPEWHRIILEEEISRLKIYGEFDGLCLDMLDTVDDYPQLKPGMIDLVKDIREWYPELILVPNRGFAVLPDILPYIDGFKYEEMSSRYDSSEKKYVLEEDEGELETLERALDMKDIPVFVLDHVKTEPPDTTMARHDFERCREIAGGMGRRFVWYANSVEQDHPAWSWLDFR